MVLTFNLRQQTLNIIQTPACPQPQFGELGAVGAAFCRFFDGLQTGT